MIHGFISIALYFISFFHFNLQRFVYLCNTCNSLTSRQKLFRNFSSFKWHFFEENSFRMLTMFYTVQVPKIVLQLLALHITFHEENSISCLNYSHISEQKCAKVFYEETVRKKHRKRKSATF